LAATDHFHRMAVAIDLASDIELMNRDLLARLSCQGELLERAENDDELRGTAGRRGVTKRP
jgi:hypothetical protein